MLKSYQDLTVWQKAFAACIEVYRLTRRFPADERFGLTSQLRRAAVSVPSNIAEGYGRGSTPDYIRALRIAYASNCELETQALIARELGYLKPDEAEKLGGEIREVERMLKALVRALGARHSNPRALGPSNPS